MSTQHRCSVVILGGGFAGVAAAREFASCCRGGLAKVTVIDRNAYHVFTPLLYEAATGFVEHENLGTSKLLRSGVAVDLADLLARWHADFLAGDVTGIDWDRRQVLLGGGAPVPFDHLIVALGSEMNYFGIAGMRERALVLKNAADADRLRQRIHDLLHKREQGKLQRFEIVIGGGGATGVELSAELTMFLRRHVVKGHLGANDYGITLVEASPRLLGAMDLGVSVAALDRLRALGVKVFRDTAIKEVADRAVTLVPRACKPGETTEQLLCDFKQDGSKVVDADAVVWCGGIRGSAALERLGLSLDERGKRITVGPTLEIDGRKDAYAVGDSALLMDPVRKVPAPWLAQAAMVQGRVAARRIITKVLGGEVPAYDFPTYPMVVPLGGKYCIAVAFGRTFTGFTGWVIHELATLRYFLTILPPFQAVRHWWNGALIYAGND